MSQRMFFKKSRDERSYTLAGKRSFNDADYESEMHDEFADEPIAVSKVSSNGLASGTILNAYQLPKSTTTKPKNNISSLPSEASRPNLTSTISVRHGGTRDGISRSGEHQPPVVVVQRQFSNSSTNSNSNSAAVARPTSSKSMHQVVVSHVKESDVVHQLGEKQAFKSDLQFYFDLLEPTVSTNTTLTRSLAAMNLTKKLVNESFESTFSAMDGLRTVLLKLNDSGQDSSGCLPLAYAVFIWVLVVKYNRTLGRSIWNSLLQGCDFETASSRSTSSGFDAGSRKEPNNVNTTASATSDRRKVVVRAKEIFIYMKPHLSLQKNGVQDFIKQCDTERGILASDIFHDILLHIDISRHSVRSVEYLREERSLDSLIALAASQIICLKDLLENSGPAKSAAVDAFQLDLFNTALIRQLSIVERYLHVLTTLCTEHEDASSHVITKSNSLMLQQIDWLLNIGVEYCLRQTGAEAAASVATPAQEFDALPRKTRAAAKQAEPTKQSVPVSSLNIGASHRNRTATTSIAVISAWQGVLNETCNVVRAVVSCCDLWRTTVGDMPHCIPAIISCCLLVPGVLTSSAPCSKNSTPTNSQDVYAASTKSEAVDDDEITVIASKTRMRRKNSFRPPSAAAAATSAPSSSSSTVVAAPSSQSSSTNIQRYNEHHDYKLEGVAAVALSNLCDGSTSNRQQFLDYRRPGVVDDPVKAFVALLRRRCGDSLHHNQTLEAHRSELTEERLGRQSDVSAESIFRAVNRALEHADAAVDSTAIATYVAYFFAYMVKDDASLAESIVLAWNTERDAAVARRTATATAAGADLTDVDDAVDVDLNILHIFDIMERFEQFLLLTKLSSPDDIANMAEIRQHFRVLVEAAL